MLFFRKSLVEEPRPTSYSIVGGVAGIIMGWALLHDQYLVRIAPEHFTEYHEPLWGIQKPWLLAAAYAVVATIGPGLILGMVYLILGRGGDRKKVTRRYILLGALVVVSLTELICLATGLWVWKTGDVFYPDDWFPDHTLPIKITQTIQITAYLASAVLSTVFAFLIYFRRRRDGLLFRKRLTPSRR